MTYKNGVRVYKKAECANCHQFKFMSAHGLCRACYSRERLNGTVEYKPKRVRATCIEQDCSNPVVSHGRCEKHRIRSKKRTVTITLSETPSAIYQREWRKKQVDLHKNNNLKKSFGITLEQYNEMLEAQGGKCAICGCGETSKRNGSTVSLAVDHCHSKGHVRKLLCRGCNHGLGNFKDDPALLRAAADYLESSYKVDRTVSAAIWPGIKEAWEKAFSEVKVPEHKPFFVEKP